MNNNILSKSYSFFLGILPLLAVYRFFIPGINIAEFIILFYTFMALLFEKINPFHSNKAFKLFFLILLYSLLITLIMLCVGSYSFSLLHRFIRFSLYIFCLIYTSQKFFNNDIFSKTIINFSVLLSLLLVIQYIIYFGSGNYFKMYGFLPMADESRNLIDYTSIFSYETFRPSAVLTEPSHCAQVMFIPLIILLFKEDVKNKWFKIIAITLGIFLTKSLWGFLLICVIFAFYFFSVKNLKKSFYFLIFLITFTIILLRSGMINDIFSRISLDDLQGSSTFTGRFGGYENLKNYTVFSILFGNGFGNLGNVKYANSIIYILNSIGIIGCFLFLVLFIFLYIKCSKMSKLLIICLILLCFGSSFLISTSIVPILSLIMFYFEKENIKIGNIKYER